MAKNILDHISNSLDTNEKYQDFLKWRDSLINDKEEQDARVNERYQNAGWMEKRAIEVGQTFNDIVGSILAGAFKQTEGILDSGLQIGAIVSGKLGNEELSQSLLDALKKDATSGAMGLFGFDNTSKSGLNNLPGKAQDITRGVGQGVGQVSMTAAYSFLGGKPAAIAALFLGAYGNAVDEALNQGASMEDATKYGALSATVELVTEKITGGVSGKFIGGGMLDKYVNKYASSTLAKLAMDAAGEGFEEALSEAVQPFLKMTYNDKGFKETLNDATSQEQFGQILDSAIVGALTSVAFGGASAQYSTKGMAQSSAQEIKAIEKQQSNLYKNNKINSIKQDSIDKSLDYHLKTFNKQVNRLNTLEEKQAFIKEANMETYYDEEAKLRTTNVEDRKSMNYTAFKSSKRIEGLKLAKEVNESQSNVLRLGEKLGKKVVIAETQDGINGYFDPDSQTIVVSSKATNPTEVFVHELTHKLEGTKQYSNFVRYLMDSIKTNDSLRQKVLGNRITLEAIENAYKGQIDGMDKKSKEYVILTEFVAKATSEALFTDKKSIDRLVTTDKTIAEKIYDWVKAQIKKIKNPSTPEERAYLSMLKKAEKLYSDAIESEVGGVRLSDLANNNSDERFSREDLRKESIRKTLAQQLLSSEAVFLDFTPTFLQKIGLPNKPLTITQNHLLDIIDNQKHNIPLSFIENDLINELNNPALVLNDPKFDGIIILSDKLDSRGNPIIIPIALNFKSYINAVHIDATVIKSVYGKSKWDAVVFAMQNNIVYYDKKRVSDMYRLSGSQLPNFLSGLTPNVILQQVGNNVNINETVKDSQGDLLSSEQVEFFKDSKVRDTNGNLLVMYHGSNNANFNVFDSKKIGKNYPADSVGGFYFTNRKQTAQYFGRSGHTKEVYLNIKNPYILKADDNWANGSDWFDISSQHHVEQAKNNGHDGIIVEHKYGNMVLAFESNQIKNTSNLNPTSNDDIRLSKAIEDADSWNDSSLDKIIDELDEIDLDTLLIESELMSDVELNKVELSTVKPPRIKNSRPNKMNPYDFSRPKYDSTRIELTPMQKSFYKNTKLLTKNGELPVVYHGSKAKFDVFDKTKVGSAQGSTRGQGFYFTPNIKFAEQFGDVRAFYLKAERPYIVDSEYLSRTRLNAKYLIERYDIEHLSMGYIMEKVNGGRIFDLLDVIKRWTKKQGTFDFKYDTDVLKDLGFDSVVDNDQFVVFDENQIKLIDNTKPTSNDDIRLSIDSRGEELTKEQQEFFKDSKVLDENGNLLVVYHGTKNSSFYEFDGSTVRKDNMLGKGFYFSTSSEVASKYGNRTITAYLNLKNPFKTNNKNPYFGSSLARVFTDAELKPYINQKTGTVKTESINNLLMDKGYDGIMTDGGLIVAFKSNQIKLVENTKPTNDKDIRFSITDDRLVKKYSNLDLNQDISKLDGVPAIRLNDGSILPFTENHIPFIKNNNIDVNDIESGGWIGNGQYNSSAQSDTMRYVNQQKSKQRVEELRKNRNQRFSIAEIKEKYREYTENVWMYEKDNYIKLDTIKIKKELRNQGIGTQFMKDLIGYADQENKIIGLTPSDAFGASSVSRLKEFYKRFGFKENKGKNSHMQYMETMIRMPQAMGANKTNDIRFSIYLSEDQRKILAKAGSIEYSTNKDKTGFNVQVLNSKGFLEYSGSSISVSQLYEKFGDEVAKHIKNNATNVTSTLNKSEIASYIGDELKSEDYSNIVSKAKKHFGTTQNIVTAGYINTDGSMLNFGDGHGYRIMDHRDIAEIMDLSGGDAMYKYIELGNIRIMPETGGIELSKKPTDKQLSSLSRFINYFKGEITVDLWAASETSFNDSYNLTYVEYEEKTSSMKILNDIKKFYDEGINPSEQSDIRYSLSGTYTKQQVNKIIANRVNQKYYTKSDAEVVINTALTDIIKVPEGKVTISNKNFEQVVRELWDVLNTKQPGNRLGYALQIADYIMENAYAQKMIDTSADRKNLELLATLNQYKKRIDLEAITQDLNTALGANKQPFNTWGKRSTTNESLTMDQVEAELKANGIELKGANTIEKFIDLNKMYTDASKEVKRQINELKNELTEEERHQAQQDISRSIMNAFETKGKASSFKKQLNTYISKISMLREQLDKAYKVNRAVNNLLATINKVEGLEKYRSVELYPLSMEIVSGIKTLKKVRTWRGNLNNANTVRELFKKYSTKVVDVEGKMMPLYEVYHKMNNGETFDTPFGEMIDAIATGQGELTLEEIRAIDAILLNFIHNVKNQDTIFFQNRNQSETEVATRAINETKQAIPIAQSGWKYGLGKYTRWLQAPYWRLRRLSNYNNNGYFSQMFDEFKDGFTKQAGFKMKVVKHFEDFFKAHKDVVSKWREPITVDGGKTMSKGQIISLILTSKRQQAQMHLFNISDFQGTIRLSNEKLATKKRMKDALLQGEDMFIDESLIVKLEAELNDTDKAFIKLANEFFNDISKNAKIETDTAIFGVSNVVDDNYFPLKVADDQIYKQLGDNEMDFKNLFSVYNASFNKAVRKNAKNKVVIENVLDVINRHTEQMASYYGLAIPMKTFNRVWNKKTDLSEKLMVEVQKVDPEFQTYMVKLFKDMQGVGIERDGFDKFLSKVRGWSARAALGANPKVLATQFASLFSAHAVGFNYKSLLKGLSMGFSRKTDYETLYKYSPILYDRAREGNNIDVGLLKEGTGVLGKIDTLTNLTTKPIGMIDNLVIGSIWNAAIDQLEGKYSGEELYREAAALTEKAVIVTQANYSPLFRPSILRTQSSALQLVTMFMSEPLQLYSQISGAIDMIKTAKANAKYNRVDKAVAQKQIDEAYRQARTIGVSVIVNATYLVLLTQAFKWIKGQDDEDETFLESTMNEVLAHFIGMFPIIRDAYTMLEGYDIQNMYETGLSNVVRALQDMYQLVDVVVFNKAEDTKTMMAAFRRTILGLGQTFGVPIRNIETYTKGIIEKFSESAIYKYEDYFYNQSYAKDLQKAIENGDQKMINTVVDAMFSSKNNEFSSKPIVKEVSRLTVAGYAIKPYSVPKEIIVDDETMVLTGSQYRKFKSIYGNADEQVEQLLNSKYYSKLEDEQKAKAIRLLYNYYYNLAKEEVTGESFTGKLGLLMNGSNQDKVAIILAYSSDEKVTGMTRKQAVTYQMKNMGFSLQQRNAILEYMGYSV